MVKLIERYEAEDGTVFETYSEAKAWEERGVILRQLSIIFDAECYSRTDCKNIAEIIWKNRDEIVELLQDAG